VSALGHSQQEAASEPTGQTHRQPGTSVPGQASAGSQTGLSRESGAQRTDSKASKGNKAHGSIGCELAGNGDSHYGLVGGAKPWSRSALDTNRAGFGLVSGRAQSVGGRAECDRDAPLGVCSGRKAPMQRRRRTGQPEQALGPDPIRCASARRTASALRRGKLQRACSLDGTAPRTDQPGNRLGSSGNGGAKQGQP
jgi:hypothetical protein